MKITNQIFSENNPAGIKAVLKHLKISELNVRLPLVEASEDLKKDILEALKKLNKR